MLPRDAEDAWLDRATEPSALLDLCVPLEETGMRAVGDAVNDARHDEPDCLEPAAPAAHSVLSVAFSMTTGEVGRSCPSTGSADVLGDVHAAHHAAHQRVVGRQPSVVER